MGVLGLLLILASPMDVKAQETAKSETDTIEINGVTYDKRTETDKDDVDVSEFSVENTNTEINELETLKTTLVGMTEDEVKTLLSKYIVDPNIKLTDVDKQKIQILKDELDKSVIKRWREDSEAEFIGACILGFIAVCIFISLLYSIVTDHN